jgi:hypothetical protein
MLIVGLAFSEDAKYQRAAVLNEASRLRIWCQQDERHVSYVTLEIHLQLAIPRFSAGSRPGVGRALLSRYQVGSSSTDCI